METANRPTPAVAGRGRKPMPTGGPRLPNPAIGLQLTSYVPTSRYPKNGIPDGFPPTPAEIPRQTDFPPVPQGPGIAQRDPPDALQRAFPPSPAP